MSAALQRFVPQAAAIAAAALVLAAGGHAATRTAPEGRIANNASAFVTTCGFSHRNTDDPIVLPRRPGFSHDHTFVGNVSTDAFSTRRSLLRAGTTCDRKADTAAYWAPTLYLDGSPLEPSGAVVYYRRLTAGRVRPYPSGLTIVAGNSHAQAPQSLRVAFWDCGVIKTTLYGPISRAASAEPVVPAASSRPPACPPGSKLQMHVNFPDCWNGRSLDSVDHKRHMAYSRRGSCPASHPVPVPELSVVYQFQALPGVIALSSGSVLTLHADFINTWRQKPLEALVERCLNRREPCGVGS